MDVYNHYVYQAVSVKNLLKNYILLKSGSQRRKKVAPVLEKWSLVSPQVTWAELLRDSLKLLSQFSGSAVVPYLYSFSCVPLFSQLSN